VEQLIRAIYIGDTASVRVFLKQGVNPDVSGPSGGSALIVAASVARWEIVHLLLQAGANPNAADTSGVTALMRAATQNRDETVQALLEAGADPLIEDIEHHNALWHSKQRTVDFRFPYIKFEFPFIRAGHGTLFMRRVWRTRSARLIRAALSSSSMGNP
jgi:hypothetical protein